MSSYARPLHYLNLMEIARLLRAREISAPEVTGAILQRIEAQDGRLKSYITVVGERAMARAKAAQDELDRGIWRGPLHGVPVAVKDLADTDFAPTSAGMALRRDLVSAGNATVVARLEAAGAIILGKLAMTEGALIEHHPDLPRPVNPWGADFWTGVSSSGSGVATAAGLCYASIGSDTGGSIRFPSSACGLTGVKPTYGRVSRHGVFPLAETLDHLGPMARSAEDAAALLAAIAGEDAGDPTTLRDPVPDYLGALGQGIRGMRLGIDASITDEIDADVAAVLEHARTVLVELGARVVSVRLPPRKNLLSGAMPLLVAEAACAHVETFPSRAGEYGPSLAGLLQSASTINAVELARANIERRRFSGLLDALFRDVDLLLVPAMPRVTPRADAPLDMGQAVYTTPFNMTGNPTITLRGGTDASGMPIGFQLVGRHLDEALLLRAGYAFQQLTHWHTLHPALAVGD